MHFSKMSATYLPDNKIQNSFHSI